MANKRKSSSLRRKRAAAIRQRNLLILVGILFILLILLIIGIKSCSGEKGDRRAKTKISGDATVEEIRLSAAGDNLISDRIITQASERSEQEGAYDFSPVYANLIEYLGEHDINWIDVETCINDDITPSGYPYFSTPGQNGLDLWDAGFNVFSLANNHTYDNGADGMEAELSFFRNNLPDAVVTGLWKTEDAVGAAGTLSSVTDSYEDEALDAQSEVYYDQIPIYTTEKGHKIAFLTYTEMTNAITYGSFHETPSGSENRVIYLYESELIKQQIETAKEAADAVVVSCHWGDEGSHQANAAQREYAQQIADWGADLIIGVHPHVLQEAEWVTASDGREVFCAYSIGNLVSTQQEPDQLIGALLDVTMVIDKNGVTVEEPKLVPVVTHYGENGTDATVYLLKDYTDDLAAENGIGTYMLQSGYTDTFDLEYIEGVLKEVIDESFLDLD